MTGGKDIYESPLARYAGRDMRTLFSPAKRVATWRRLWIALAEAEMELGLPITQAQVDELKAGVDQIDFEKADDFERRFRHDVMAHVHAYGEVAPSAKGIIHLGATSCFVTDNADLVLLRAALDLLLTPLASTVHQLSRFAAQQRAVPCVAYTHFQPAQLTTVGKRACLWIQDFVDDLLAVRDKRDSLRFRGVKGTTGTQGSFLALFDGDHAKVKELDARVARKMGFEKSYPVTGQTYPRKLDFDVLAVVSSLAISAAKFATDMRLLSHEREVEEPFESEQIGSSAMAYKRNPMRSERVCSLARFVTTQLDSAAQTAMNQWLERTLDDSANRRLILPESFLATDGLMNTVLNVASGLVVHEAQVASHVERELPFMATEEILMRATKAGGDRQELHELIRRHSMAAIAEVKAGRANDLFDRIAADQAFGLGKGDIDALRDAKRFIGRSPEQVDEFLGEVVEPALEGFRDRVDATGDVRV